MFIIYLGKSNVNNNTVILGGIIYMYYFSSFYIYSLEKM